MPKKHIGKTILLVEDDHFILEAYKDSMEREGFGVEVARDGVEALEKLAKITPDLILLDIVMPLKNGFEVMEELRHDERLNRIPIVILSNLGQDSDIVRGRELGAVDYLVKANYSMKEVMEKIKHYLAASGRED